MSKVKNMIICNNHYVYLKLYLIFKSSVYLIKVYSCQICLIDIHVHVHSSWQTCEYCFILLMWP